MECLIVEVGKLASNPYGQVILAAGLVLLGYVIGKREAMMEQPQKTS